MSISRRTLVLGLPVAASTILAGCGGGDKQDDATSVASSDGGAGRASAQAVSTGGTSGSFLVVAQTTGSWPSASTVLKPSDAIVQACLNGNELNVCINHLSASAIRTVSLRLKKATAWEDNKAYKFYAGGSVPADAAGALDGSLTHFNLVTASNFATTRMFYDVSAGSVIATKKGDFLTLVFSPSAAEALTATKSASTSANAAPAGGVVKVNFNATAGVRTVVLNLATELETAV